MNNIENERSTLTPSDTGVTNVANHECTPTAQDAGVQTATQTGQTAVTFRSTINELQARLTRGLQELNTCRSLLADNGIRYDQNFSCSLEDHADVLELCMLPVENEGSSTEAGGVTQCSMSSCAVDALPLPSPNTVPALTVPSEALGTTSPNSNIAQVSGPTVELREHERLKEELSIAKALLMLNNTTLNMDFDHNESTGNQVINLRGNSRMMHQFIALKQKVCLLSQQCLVLRGDLLYLQHEMNVCHRWVLQSCSAAMPKHHEDW